MFVVARSAAPASRKTDIGGYGSRIAFAALTCPGRRRFLNSIFKQPLLFRGARQREPGISRFPDAQFAHLRSGADAPSRNDGGYASAISRLDAPEVCQEFPCAPLRGRGEYRVHAAPAFSCANVHKRNAHEHTGSAEAIRHSPRNGFNGFLRALPGDRAFLPPSSLRSLLPRNLTPASGRQDHTTSPSASRAVRYRRISVHRIPLRDRDDHESPL